MSDKKYSFKNEINYENQQAKQQQAKQQQAIKDWKRNNIGLTISAILFFCILVTTLNGIRISGNLSMLLIVASMMGVFLFWP